MRIISGEFRRRLLASPPGMTTRPVPDRVKESLFSMLGQRVVGAQVVDLFSGSGAIGLEAVSRGAAGALMVEMDKRSHATLELNIRTLKAEGRCRAVRGDALGLSMLARCPRPTDLIFMDPPYPLVQTPEGWQRVVTQASALVQLLAGDGFLILRTPWPHMITPTPVDVARETGGPVARRFKKHAKPRTKDYGDVVGDRGESEGRRKAARAGGKGRGDAGLDGPGDDHELDVDDEAMEGLDASAPEGGLDLGEMVEMSEAEIAEAVRGARRTSTPPAGGGGEGGDEVDGGAGDGAGESGEPQPSVADGSIPGARGPETHRYGSMAVHFYMKG
jgi:16S rRNA (guanine(966)-N(2))-methyltransferase RsmD